MKEILELLNTLECELDDATNTLPDYNANTDSRGYIDSGKNTLYVIIDKIEKKQGTGEGCWNDINLDIKVKELQLLERIQFVKATKSRIL